MRENIQILKEELAQKIPEGWNSILEFLHQGYDSQGEFVSQQIRDCGDIVEKYTEDQPFAVRNQICSAVVSMCTEYERIAFMDGVLIGANLIFELLGDGHGLTAPQ